MSERLGSVIGLYYIIYMTHKNKADKVIEANFGRVPAGRAIRCKSGCRKGRHSGLSTPIPHAAVSFKSVASDKSSKRY
jgi:hypothetical protein